LGISLNLPPRVGFPTSPPGVFRLVKALLDGARQLVLPLQLDDRVLLRDLRVGVAGNLAGFDAAAADFLPSRDIGAAQGVRPKAGEVAAFGGRRPL
jgi:hypothetical protein